MHERHSCWRMGNHACPKCLLKIEWHLVTDLITCFKFWHFSPARWGGRCWKSGCRRPPSPFLCAKVLFLKSQPVLPASFSYYAMDEQDVAAAFVLRRLWVCSPAAYSIFSGKIWTTLGSIALCIHSKCLFLLMQYSIVDKAAHWALKISSSLCVVNGITKGLFWVERVFPAKETWIEIGNCECVKGFIKYIR